jgi:hypothetical protein
MRELLRAKSTIGYTSRGAVDRPNRATFKPLNLYKKVTSMFHMSIRHELDLNKLVSAPSNMPSGAYQVVFFHLVYTKASFWHPIAVHCCDMS